MIKNILNLGDEAVYCDFGSDVNEKINLNVISYFSHLKKLVKENKIEGICNLTPSYNKLIISFNLAVTNFEKIKKILEGLKVENINQQKADLLYNEIDRNPLFEGAANKDDRSNMNVTFLLTDESKEERFNKMWNEAGINGLKGHRSVGGYRASMYNALQIESVEVLVNVMKKLEEN